jgi:hypothetical protein
MDKMEKLKQAIDNTGHEVVINRLKLISLNLKRLGLDNSEYELLIKEVETQWLKDFWSSWADYDE